MNKDYFYKLKFFDILHKVYLSLKTVKNLHMVILDHWGLFGSGRPITLKLWGGENVSIRSGTSDLQEAILVCSGYEYPIKFLRKVGNLNTIINVGAHIGTFELFIKNKYKNASIYSFEPSLDNFNLLAENIKLNKFSNITLFNKAVLNRDGVAFLDTQDLNNDAYKITEKGGQKVEGITLDSFIKEFNLKKIDLIKMDCEGSEYSILSNFKNFEICSAFFLEYHRIDDIFNHEFIENIMAENNFIIKYRIDYDNFRSGVILFVKKN